VDLGNELAEAEVIIGILTPASLKSGWAMFELGAGWSAKKSVVLLTAGVDYDFLPGPLKETNAMNAAIRSEVDQLLFEIGETLKLQKRRPDKATDVIGALVEEAESFEERRGHKLVPPGTISAFGGETLPPGWLWCDGEEFSRTDKANLFNAIGINFGKGKDDSTFKVPDLRGRFLRGLDRKASVDKEPNRRIGSPQRDLVGPHRHWLAKRGNVGEAKNPLGQEFTRNPDWTGDHYTDDDQHPQEGIGAETRPINVAINWIIKY
jgi:hypothetical protein